MIARRRRRRHRHTVSHQAMRQHPSPGSRPRIRIVRRTVPAPESIINLSIAMGCESSIICESSTCVDRAVESRRRQPTPRIDGSPRNVAASPRAVFILNTHRERAVHMSLGRGWLASFEVASRDVHSAVCE